MHFNDLVFPFSAIVAQDSVKKALIWNVINPKIGGLLISGEKGTAKSTLVRSLCENTPNIHLVELPLNVTEDMVLGSINFEYAVKYGEKAFEEGILERANGNILYVDEINLLSDHVVKILLESASSEKNQEEREKISFSLETGFILVGSMNPEEGGLRPQLLDRFGLYVEVKGEPDLRKRTEIVRRYLEYENNKVEFRKKYKKEKEELKGKITKAINFIDNVTVTDNAMQLAAVMAKEANCEGHRGELVIIETAKAIAAFDSRKTLNISDIKEAARYALPHRMREQQEQQQPCPPGSPDSNNEKEENNNEQEDKEDNQSQESSQENENNSEENIENSSENNDFQEDTPEIMENEMPNEESEQIEESGDFFQVSNWLSEKSRRAVINGNGKRSVVKTNLKQGRYVNYRFPVKNKIEDIALDATIRAAAPYQKYREKKGLALSLKKSDIRVKVREKRTGNTILFVVDASGSMGANKRMKSVKGAILSLLNDAYQKRDRVGLIAFRKQSAEVILGITRSVELAQRELSSLPTGGRTPLASGLKLAYEVIKAEKIKDKDLLPVIVLVSDGKATYSEKSKDAFQDALSWANKIASEKIKSVVIDADESYIKLHLSEKLAEVMEADYFAVEDLHAETLVSAVKMSV